MGKYEFQYKDMAFSKDGQLDELIALDRYAVTVFDGYQMGDTVVALTKDEYGNDKKLVGEITGILDDGKSFEIKDRLGSFHIVERNLLQKPLETEPHQMWERWAKGASSVEKTEEKKRWFENELRWLFDGYRYSLGGRIQLMLGQEHVTGKRANLTAYNCYVIRSPYGNEVAKDQFMDVVKVAFYEASIMRRGGGVGLNLSTIKTVKGSDKKQEDFIFYLDKEHPDYEELKNRQSMGKLNGVTIATTKEEYEALTGEHDNIRIINAIDSVDGLFTNMEDEVSASYDGMAVAINFNHLRERHAIVKGVNGRSSGAVSWMELFVRIANLLQMNKIDCVEFAEIYSDITHLIEQGGSRRGALMLILNVDNPHIMKFIERKRKSGFLTGANISVGIDDGFMEEVMIAKKNKAKGVPNVAIFKNALDLWSKIIESAWSSAEPGIVWLERYNKESNSWYFHEIVATNPCGEQGLPPFGVCNLGHFVLSRFFDKETKDVNWRDLERAVRISVRLQDNVIDYTDYFLEENREVQLGERRVGIGTLGLGTLMIHMELRYGSPEGNEFIDKLYKFIARTAYDASMDLADEKGAFKFYDYEKFRESGFMKRMLDEFPELDKKMKKTGIRNVTLLTQAPTGSTGTYIDNIPSFREEFGGTTTGIEPYFNWSYWRAGRLGFSEQTVGLVDDYRKENGLSKEDKLPDYFVTAMELSPLEHVQVQGAIQKWVDSSISKTANAPSDFTLEQTDELYLEGYKLGLKGITIYRDKSREAQVLSTDKEGAKLEMHLDAEKMKKKKDAEVTTLDSDNFSRLELDGNVVINVTEHTMSKDDMKKVTDSLKEMKSDTNPSQFIEMVNQRKIKKVKSRLFGMREKVRYQSGDTMSKAYVHIYVDESGTPVEVWIEPTDVRDKDMADALGRMTTQFLRFGGTQNNVEQAVKHLKAGKMMMSLPAIVGRLLNDVYYGKIEMPSFPKKQEEGKVVEKRTFEMAECVECKAKAYDKVNCICNACGQSKCN